jgi:hypothetical protein
MYHRPVSSVGMALGRHLRKPDRWRSSMSPCSLSGSCNHLGPFLSAAINRGQQCYSSLAFTVHSNHLLPQVAGQETVSQ